MEKPGAYSPSQQDQNYDSAEQPEQNVENLEGFIDILTQHQKKCEEEGKYVEAEMAMNRIKELKKQLKDRENSELEVRHQNDLYELEETHISEFNNFNEEWDKRMNEFQMHAAQLMQSLVEKQEEELKNYREQIYDKLGDHFKKSPELLNLETMQKNLARQKEYQQAHQIQVKAQELEIKERNKYYQDREQKAQVLESKLIKKQELEMESLRKRIIAGENEQKKQRALDLERMFQRYQNVKKELMTNHKKEKNFLKKGGVGFNPNMTRMSNVSQHSSAKGVNASAQKKKPTNRSNNN
jgi:hypothetical protein